MKRKSQVTNPPDFRSFGNENITNLGYIKLTGPLVNVNNAQGIAIKTQRPIPLSVLLSNKEMGGGFKSFTDIKNLKYIPLGEGASVPQLLGEVLLIQTGQPSPRFKSGTESGTTQQAKTYIPLWQVFTPGASWTRTVIMPGEWLNVLTPEESAKAMGYNPVTGETTGGNKANSEFNFNLSKYRYVNQTYQASNAIQYDPNLEVVDPKTGKIYKASEFYAQSGAPDSLYQYEIDGKTYYCENPQITVKTIDYNIPIKELHAIEEQMKVFYDPKSTEEQKQNALQVISDQGGLNDLLYRANGNKALGFGSLLRDATKIQSLLSLRGSPVSADTVGRFMEIMGLNDPTYKKIILKNPTTLTMTIPNFGFGPSESMQLKVYTDDKGRKYYSNNLSQNQLEVSQLKYGASLAQVISLGSAFNSIFNAKNPQDRQKAFLSIIDSFPGVSKNIGVNGYSFLDIYDRLSKISPEIAAKSITPDIIMKLEKDPLLSKVMASLSIKSDVFGNLPMNKQFELLLTFRDVVSNLQSPLQAAQTLKNIIQDVPGANNLIPKINNVSVVALAGALSDLAKFNPANSETQYFDPKNLMIIAKTMGLGEDLIAQLNNARTSQFLSIFMALNNARQSKNPQDIANAIALASDQLPKIFKKLSNADMIRAVYGVVGQPLTPENIIKMFLNKPELLNVLQKLTGPMVDANGNFINTDIKLSDAASLVTMAQDISDGKKLPITLAVYMAQRGLIKVKTGANGIVDVANTLNDLLAQDKRIDNNHLVKFLHDVSIDPSTLILLDQSKWNILNDVVTQYAKTDATSKQTALNLFNTEILPDITSAQGNKAEYQMLVKQLLLSKGGTINTEDLQNILEKDPKIRGLLEKMGLIPPGQNLNAPVQLQIQGLKGTYIYDPAKVIDTDVTAIISGVNKDGTLHILFYSNDTGTLLFEQDWTPQKAQDIGAKPADNIIVQNTGAPRAQHGINTLSKMSKEELLSLAIATKQLLSGNITIFKYAALISSIPTINRMLGGNSQFLKILKLVNDAMGSIQRGGVLDFETFNTFITATGLKLDSKTEVSLYQAAALGAAYSAFNKKDFAAVIFNLVKVFPNLDYSNMAMSLAKNLPRLTKGNLIDIIQVFESDPVLRKAFIDVLTKIGILKNGETSLVLKTKNGQIDVADALLTASTIFDVLSGKLDPVIAAKRLLEVPGLVKYLGNAGAALGIATDLYEAAQQFGHGPIDPLAIDKSIRALEKILGHNIGSLGFGGVNGLSYGQAIAIINGLTLAFSGKWQAALQQLMFLIQLPIFGGVSVGFVMQILFMFFPGLAGLFGKGGGSDNPDQNCPHCGCTVPDPAGGDNNRKYELGGQLCKYCGSAVRSNKNPNAIPGSPPLRSPGCVGYPWEPEARGNCGPKYRTGIVDGCDYSDGKWFGDDQKQIGNKDCAAQLTRLGVSSVDNANTANSLSLYCQDEFAYYDSLTVDGTYKTSDSGKQKDKQYQTDQTLRNMTEGEYYARVNAEIEAEFKTTPYYSTALSALKNVSDQRTAFNDYATTIDLYGTVIRDSGKKANLQQCGYYRPQGDLDIAFQQNTKVLPESCSGLAKQLNTYYARLSTINRDKIFDMFKITKDPAIRKTIQQAVAPLPGQK